MLFFIIIRLTFWQSPHGDYDHMGETINLVNNFKVEKVIFNCVGYTISRSLPIDRVHSINEMLHLMHASILNN